MAAELLGQLNSADLLGINGMAPLDAALRYGELGLPVFPVAPVNAHSGVCGCRDGAACEQVGKHPLVKWSEKATSDPAQIRSWWSWKPEANIGIPTGQRSGVLVVDIDRQHDGLATRQALGDEGFVFPPTIAARTRNGGWHFWYRTPADRTVPNTTAALAGVGGAAGIDVRGDGGYIIVPPSQRPLDQRGPDGGVLMGHYQWAAQDLGLADAPGWVTTPKPHVTINEFEGDHRFLSNFWLQDRPLVWEGQAWRTSEHAFQAAKFTDPSMRAAVQGARTPNQAKRLGRKLGQARPGWDDQRGTVMASVLAAKFSDPELAARLVATGDAALEEGNTWGDRYWGVCEGRGRNELGLALMRLRADLGGAGVPEWYRAPGLGPARVGRPTSGRVERRAEAALASEVQRVTGAVEQGRNTALFQAAANLFEIANTGHLDAGQVRSELTAAALSVGLGEREIAQTLDAQERRKAGVRRPGWDPVPGPTGGQAPLGLRRQRTALQVGLTGRQGIGR